MRRQVDVPRLLSRLGIASEERGPTMLWACCPSKGHDDRTPSWRIVNDPADSRHGQHRCYGCGFGGWAIHLVEELTGLGRDEARGWIHDANASLASAVPERVEVQQVGRGVFRLPLGVKTEPLEKWPPDHREYIVSRGVTAKQVDAWRIGYAPGAYDPATNRLAGRVVFPVHDGRGTLIGYTARALSPRAKRRYKEPRKAEGADLGAVFGERAWPAVRAQATVVVTEGAFDALAVERVCSKASVAAVYGSQLHQGHLARLSGFSNIIVATDPDDAGNAIAKELDAQLGRWCTVRRLTLPDGEDCASVEPRVLIRAIDDAWPGVLLGSG